jgi:hypothetical protein
MRGAIPALPNTPSWRGAQLKHRDKFTFYVIFIIQYLMRLGTMVHHFIVPTNYTGSGLINLIINRLSLSPYVLRLDDHLTISYVTQVYLTLA